MTRDDLLKAFADAGLKMPTRGKHFFMSDDAAIQLIQHIRIDCAQKCYTRADHWKDNAAKAAKLCGDAIMAGVKT